MYNWPCLSHGKVLKRNLTWKQPQCLAHALHLAISSAFYKKRLQINQYEKAIGGKSKESVEGNEKEEREDEKMDKAFVTYDEISS